jgi:hypothetical protein
MAGKPMGLGTMRKIEMLRRFGLPVTHKRLVRLSKSLMDQVDSCATPEAQRLILGCSK